jgi:predicted amidohydrolase
MRQLAKALGIAIPTSFFERDGHHYYNTLAMIGPDGEIMGIYRKSHIPDGPGYEEKFYFRRATPASRCGTCSAPASAWACAGTSGIPNARARWR